ncbi:regulator of microtubule dynamics protein 2 isoform X4 [Cavia porcellus]|uniref:regulator of microtubule dynamics protein 2 isoform X4 n=2 Tax=Cavia porcellus TaxID=10141 RepID=UPI002FE40086
MGKCLSCCKEDKSFQSDCFEDQFASDPQHHGVSSVSQPNISFGLNPYHPSATYAVSTPKRSRKSSCLSSPSTSSSFSGKSPFLFFRLQKSKSLLCWCQSRADFDSEEDTNVSDGQSCSNYFDSFRSNTHFSSCKLSRVACNRTASFFDTQPNNQDIFNLNEIEIFSKSPSYIPSMNESTAGITEEENFAVLSQVEDKPSSTEIPKIRYITANTDTEEQSFPVHTALNTHTEELKLDILLQKADHLRMTESGKMESFELLCDHKEKFRDEIEFVWRFARAYGDMFELSANTQDKKHYANIGKTIGEKAITRAPMNGHCHLWYAVLCGYVSQFEGLQNKINYGHRFKEHLDIAIQLLPEEPFLYYLNGRYCYTVSKLSWIEKKMAATLFGKVPSSTVQEALCNFLKAEEIHPGYSLLNYMYLAKCYVDLEENQNAWKFCNLALLLPTVTKEDKEAQTEVKAIIKSLKRVLDFEGDNI